MDKSARYDSSGVPRCTTSSLTHTGMSPKTATQLSARSQTSSADVGPWGHVTLCSESHDETAPAPLCEPRWGGVTGHEALPPCHLLEEPAGKNVQSFRNRRSGATTTRRCWHQKVEPAGAPPPRPARWP